MLTMPIPNASHSERSEEPLIVCISSPAWRKTPEGSQRSFAALTMTRWEALSEFAAKDGAINFRDS
jgi:hypothetical protein